MGLRFEGPTPPTHRLFYCSNATPQALTVFQHLSFFPGGTECVYWLAILLLLVDLPPDFAGQLFVID